MSEITQYQLDVAFNDGFTAAREGFAIEYCPMSLSGEERIEWQKGWHDWASQGE